MIPADELRAAANKSRMTGALVRGDHWRAEADELGRGWDIWTGRSDVIAFGLAYDNAAWASLASPALAEPLAQWLEALASGWEKSTELSPGGSEARFARHPALAVARVINRGA